MRLPSVHTNTAMATCDWPVRGTTIAGACCCRRTPWRPDIVSCLWPPATPLPVLLKPSENMPRRLCTPAFRLLRQGHGGTHPRSQALLPAAAWCETAHAAESSRRGLPGLADCGYEDTLDGAEHALVMRP